MGIRINRVSVKNLGPLNDFNQKFGLVNLIYGHNEKGKTYLVEFIYRSLFKNMTLSNLRTLSASGQLTVTGLESKETLFSPNSRKKLEDFWAENKPGLPRDISKLLVVKGGDLDFSPNNPAGLDDQILKEFLSGEVLLDKIASKIKSTESSSTYVGGRISGAQRGLVKEYNELTEDIKQIDGYLQEVNLKISRGKRFELIREIEDIRNQLALQEQAKRHLAYTISQRISSLSVNLDEIPSDLLDEADRLILEYQHNESALTRKKQEFDENLEKSRNYLWLESAITEYQRLVLLESQARVKTSIIWLIATLISVILAITLVLIEQPYFGIGSILLSLIFGFFYLRSFKKVQSNELQRNEIEKIELDYKDKFEVQTRVGVAVLLSKQKELQPFYFSLTQINNDIDTYTKVLDSSKHKINSILKRLTKQTIEPVKWQTTVNTLREKRNKFDDNIRKLQNELSKLDVEEETYLETPVYMPEILPQRPPALDNSTSRMEIIRMLKEEIEGKSETSEHLTLQDALEVDRSFQEKYGEYSTDEQAELNTENVHDPKIMDLLPYDKIKQTVLKDLLDSKQDELNELEGDLQLLKQAVCSITRSDLNIQWEDLIEKLSIKRLDIVNQYKEVTASIIAQITVNEVLGELRLLEANRIEEGLMSPIVSQSLLATTGHYDRVEKDGGDIYVSGQYGRYKVKELSTGAREQVLLGLRIGFASRLLAGEPLFLILDDAFQHSDWERRVVLVDKMADLANIGWQIIYFSMDDHIKRLFEERVEPIFRDQYQMFELNS